MVEAARDSGDHSKWLEGDAALVVHSSHKKWDTLHSREIYSTRLSIR